MVLEAGPDLLGQHHQKGRLQVKHKNARTEPEQGAPQGDALSEVHPACIGFDGDQAGTGSRTIGASRTGRLIKAAKMPRAMAMYQTTL